jgi:uncharacterized protein YqeY
MMKDQLRVDLTEAMRQRDEVRVATLRLALAAITKAEVAGKEQVTLSDGDVVAVLRTEIRKRHEAAEMYETGARPDRAVRERAEADVLGGYLPPEMTDADLAAVVAAEVAALDGTGVTGGKALGLAVKAVRSRVGDGADGARVAAAVKGALGLE